MRASEMFLTARGKVEIVNCRALKMERRVNAWVVSSSTPAKVIARKMKNGAMTEVDGLQNNVIQVKRIKVKVTSMLMLTSPIDQIFSSLSSPLLSG